MDRLSKSLAVCSSFILGMSLLAGYATAAPVVDQYQLNGADQIFAIHADNGIEGQSFTMRRAGRIEALELSLFLLPTPGNLDVTIVDMSGGDIVAAPVLGLVTLTPSDIGPDPLTLSLAAVTGTLIDFSAFNIVADVGDVLGFQLSAPNTLPANYGIRLALTDAYAGGAFYANAIPTTSPHRDAAFKVFVSPIPEPATLGLLALPLFLMGFALRRR